MAIFAHVSCSPVSSIGDIINRISTAIARDTIIISFKHIKKILADGPSFYIVTGLAFMMTRKKE